MATFAQKKWTRDIHVAKNRLRLDDDAYRAVLSGSAGVESAAEIRSWQQYEAVMAAFRSLGFVPKKAPEKPEVDPQEVRQKHMITARQEYYIKGLWRLASREKDEKSLRSFVRRITGAGDVTWLTKSQARDVILALRQIASDAGFAPDSKDGA